MDNKLYSIKQVCRIQNCDINQLHDRIKTDKNRLLVYLKNTVVFEAKINEIDDSELSRLHLISDEDMKEESFAFTQVSAENLTLSEKARFLAKRGNTEVIISYIEVVTTQYKTEILRQIRYEKTLYPVEVGRHGYYELCEDTIINNIDNVFSDQKVLLEKLKFEKEGYIRYLQTPYLISLKDIYMLSEDVNKCSNHKKNLPKDTNTNVTNTHVTEVDATLILPITPKQAIPKPSETCRVGSEIICIELKRIIEQRSPSPLNLDTVWIALLNQAETNVESYFEKVNEKIIREKNTNKVLDKDKTRYHINNAIEWASSI